MSGPPARLDHWASRIRNPEHLPGGDLRHDGFTDDEAMELSTLLTEAANEIVRLQQAVKATAAEATSARLSELDDDTRTGTIERDEAGRVVAWRGGDVTLRQDDPDRRPTFVEAPTPEEMIEVHAYLREKWSRTAPDTVAPRDQAIEVITKVALTAHGSPRAIAREIMRALEAAGLTIKAER